LSYLAILYCEKDCPSMAVSPDDFFIVLLSVMLSTEKKKREFKSHRYIAFSLGNISSKFNIDICMHTSEMSIYLLHDRDIQIDQLY
jgi:hypothetical protein